MEKARGCAECLKTNKPLNHYTFYNLLGQEFVLFVCNECIADLSESISNMPLGIQVSYLTDLGQIIGKAR